MGGMQSPFPTDAAVENTPATELDFTLYDHVDPEALDQFFAPERTLTVGEAPIVITFDIAEYQITIQNDGTITIEAPEPAE